MAELGEVRDDVEENSETFVRVAQTLLVSEQSLQVAYLRLLRVLEMSREW